jgi:hypothetical protein
VIEVAATIHAPAAVVWQLLIDTHAWSEWGPSVRAVDCPDRFIGHGTRGRVQTAALVWLPFEITDWEEGKSWRWRVAGIPATGHRVTPSGTDSCELAFTIPSWAPLCVPVCRAALRRLMALANARRT